VTTDRVLLTLTVQVIVDNETADSFEGFSKSARSHVSALVAQKIMIGDYELDTFEA
jgi:hypothetical protein